MYIVFIMGVLVILYQLHHYRKLNNKRSEANKVIGTYKHKSHITSFYASLLSSMAFYMVPILEKKFSYILWLSPMIVIALLRSYRTSQKVELFDTGIQVFGDFVEWRRIKKLEYIENEISFVTSDEEPLYYTISKIGGAERCYREMVVLTPHIIRI